MIINNINAGVTGKQNARVIVRDINFANIKHRVFIQQLSYFVIQNMHFRVTTN